MTLVDRLDTALGDTLERAMLAHHRRRLRRHGQLEALVPASPGLWARTATAPPRAGNAIEVLVDGARALPAMAEAIRGARRHVHVCSWHLDPEFELERGDGSGDGPGGGGGTTVRELLAEAAERVPVRVLVWAGAPVPVFAPRRGQVREARDALVRGTKIRCELDATGRALHCHHEKIVIVDDEVAFVGGIDMTSLAGDRYDTSDHPWRPSIGWHDASTHLRGPVLRDVAAHFALRWEDVTGEALDLPDPPASLPSSPGSPGGGDVELQLVRTVPERNYRALPRGEFSVLEAYMRALRSARSLIYLENQFLWSPEIVAVLESKLRDPPSDDFRLVVLLPAKPNNGEDDTRGMVGRLVAADAGARRFLAATIQSRTGERVGPLYVHAKVAIVDDGWLAVGSANLNEHSLFNDSEVDVVTCDAALARATRLQLWAEHLEREPADVDGEPRRLVDELWRPIAAEQLERRRSGAPATHRLVELPGVSRRADRLRGPLQSLVVDG
jgi:phosphatidylserine/phosphatidylglycerophosphate/cardiolipin synthase-like enzyme